MDRFLASGTHRIDAKGRVSVPARFRAIIQKRGYTELYALQAIDTPSLQVGGLDLLDRWEEKLAGQDPLLQPADDLSAYIHGDGNFLKLDGDGRISVTDFIRQHTGVADEITFVGRGLFFEMWEPLAWDKQRQAVRARLLAMRESGNALSQVQSPE